MAKGPSGKSAEVLPDSDSAAVWRPEHSRRFVFVGRSYEPGSGEVSLNYMLDDVCLREVISLPPASPPPHRWPAIEAALDLLHWVAGCSYWKAGCPAEVSFSGNHPNQAQAAWLTRLFRAGLAEFAYRNGLDPAGFPEMPGQGDDFRSAEPAGLKRRTLVPIGGGKDSLVAWSRLQAHAEDCRPVQIGNSVLIQRLGLALSDQHLLIPRQLDPTLARLNAQGAWNGHVPVTAINAAVMTLAALVLDYDRVAFANERSADEATLHDESGRAVNHQFSKSFEFERMMDGWIRRWIACDLKVFSLLRQDRELGVCREFAGLTAWHGLFSSCNRNFHLEGPRTNRWCGQCPKCHFVFLALAPFMTPAALIDIFGRDLLEDADQIDGFADLLALDGRKPFECVGEAQEARAALAALAASPAWSRHAVVSALSPRLKGLALPTLEQVCRPAGPHLIPSEWARDQDAT